jgi:hypothetical protein
MTLLIFQLLNAQEEKEMVNLMVFKEAFNKSVKGDTTVKLNMYGSLPYIKGYKTAT